MNKLFDETWYVQNEDHPSINDQNRLSLWETPDGRTVCCVECNGLFGAATLTTRPTPNQQQLVKHCVCPHDLRVSAELVDAEVAQVLAEGLYSNTETWLKQFTA